MSDLSTSHLGHIDRIQSDFFGDGDGLAAVAARSRVIDEVVVELFHRVFGDNDDSVAALAVGGYGRKQLFPCSDVDLLFLFRRESDSRRLAGRLSELLTLLWDAKLRVSQSVRTPAECSRLAADNAELHISLLDVRFLAGSQEIYNDLRSNTLPKFYRRERKSLLKQLVELTRSRHEQFGKTIYHLEPDLKEGPGGLRDHHLACWISQLAHVEDSRLPAAEEHLPADAREHIDEAKRFLYAARCYVHYFTERDRNQVLFELQDRIAEQGKPSALTLDERTADWMRELYRGMRSVNRLATRMMEEHATPKNSLFTMFRDRKSKLSNADFSVAGGRVYFRDSHSVESRPELALRLAEFVGRHGLPLAAKTERVLQGAQGVISAWAGSGAEVWPFAAAVFRQPYLYRALSAMRESKVLFAIFPELEDFDCLVVRDFYHRYTVDEHTLVAIRILKDLDPEGDKLSSRFARLAAELQRSERLYFALLFHDAGKGVRGGNHADHSVAMADGAMERIGMPAEDRQIARFLIDKHLAMSEYITKRDISDPETVESFARVVGTIEKLRALTLMTYADSSAVNPSAMSSWRKEMLWQLYLGTYNRLTGDFEDRRISSSEALKALEGAAASEDRDAARGFLAGLPERYIQTHSPEQIRNHFELSKVLKSKAAAVRIERRYQLYEIVVISADRPFLFASLCATLAAFGLSIEHAEAFGNERGLVLDTFRVALSPGRGSTVLDESEQRALARTLRRVIEGNEDVQELMKRRKYQFAARPRATVAPEVAFDNETSSRASIFHIVAEDRTGLLYDLTSKVSQLEYDIEVVMIETRGHRAIDIFYVVGPDGKLSDEQCDALCSELRGACLAEAA